MPRVTVVIPVYNQAQYLGQAIESVFRQTYRDWELIVVDDGSTDDAAGVVRRFAPRLRYIRKPNGGTPTALNAGIRAARGELIAWLSADDWMVPEKLERQVAHYDAHRPHNPDLGLIYSDYWVKNEIKGTEYYVHAFTFANRLEWRERLLATGCLVNGSTTLTARSCFERVGLFDEALAQSHDYDMWIRLSEFYEFGHVPEGLTWYRIHRESLSQGPDAFRYRPVVKRKHGVPVEEEG